MERAKIQQIFDNGWNDYSERFNPSPVQSRAAFCLMNCKSVRFGYNISRCDKCEYTDIHANSCRNRNCPNCQAVLKEIWIDARSSEVIDADYFHVVFTVPAQLNPLIYANQKILYGLLHKCSAETLLELSKDKKYLGATPGIIQVLHAWNQELDYHVHMHCSISGGGITETGKRKRSKGKFFIPVYVLRDKFKGKFLAELQKLYQQEKLIFSRSCEKMKNGYYWREFRDSLYQKDWCPYIKETFNGFGNAIDYLGRYTHRIAISNSRIISTDGGMVSFRAKDYRTNENKVVTITHQEFMRRFLQHVLPKGFQKIRYYGLLANRMKKKRLGIVFRIQNHRRFKSKYTGMEQDVMLYEMFHIDVHICPCCGKRSMRHSYRTFKGIAMASG